MVIRCNNEKINNGRTQMMWRVVQTRYEGERCVQCQWEEAQNKKEVTG